MTIPCHKPVVRSTSVWIEEMINSVILLFLRSALVFRIGLSARLHYLPVQSLKSID
ncbi:MAG: hypothetical protein D084_Lepto4C00594G0006 [Leptospirillum sp. Group IV 'UBA BS']|nr:MAG: hypothetical protein D084_Lepto4C00594G0006 [Leptospirillum sp. Group IV 'UBA BS']